MRQENAIGAEYFSRLVESFETPTGERRLANADVLLAASPSELGVRGSPIVKKTARAISASCSPWI